MKEDEKRKGGCCLGGCCWFMFIVFISFCAGWLFSNYEHNSWDIQKTKEDSLHRSKAHLSNIKGYLSGTFSWLSNKSADNVEKKDMMIPEIPGTQDWAKQADSAAAKGYQLLLQAQKVTGEERERLVRVARQELKNALDNYSKAEQVDTGNQQISQKIAKVSQMLERLGAR